MAALTEDTERIQLAGGGRRFTALAEVLLFAGALAVFTSSSPYARPGSEAPDLRVAGVVRKRVDNRNGEDGDLPVDVDVGAFPFENSEGADELTEADIGSPAFIVDDNTVAKTSNGGARSEAGILECFDDDGRPVIYVGEGRRKPHVVPLPIPEPVALNGTKTYHVICPVDGVVEEVDSVINGALTTGNATLTVKKNGVAMTGGLITITQAGSADADADSCTPTALNKVSKGDKLQVTVGGTNDAAKTANVTFRIRVIE